MDEDTWAVKHCEAGFDWEDCETGWYWGAVYEAENGYVVLGDSHGPFETASAAASAMARYLSRRK